MNRSICHTKWICRFVCEVPSPLDILDPPGKIETSFEQLSSSCIQNSWVWLKKSAPYFFNFWLKITYFQPKNVSHAPKLYSTQLVSYTNTHRKHHNTQHTAKNTTPPYIRPETSKTAFSTVKKEPLGSQIWTSKFKNGRMCLQCTKAILVSYTRKHKKHMKHMKHLYKTKNV